MNKDDLVSLVSVRVGKPKSDVETVVTSVFNVIMKEVLSGNEVKIKDFGTFKPVLNVSSVNNDEKSYVVKFRLEDTVHTV